MSINNIQPYRWIQNVYEASLNTVTLFQSLWSRKRSNHSVLMLLAGKSSANYPPLIRCCKFTLSSLLGWDYTDSKSWNTVCTKGCWMYTTFLRHAVDNHWQNPHTYRNVTKGQPKAKAKPFGFAPKKMRNID